MRDRIADLETRLHLAQVENYRLEQLCDYYLARIETLQDDLDDLLPDDIFEIPPTPYDHEKEGLFSE